MSEQHADGCIRETSTSVKRRGLLAGAAALVAGIAARQMSQPVAAATYNLQCDTGNTPNVAHDVMGIHTAAGFPANTPVLDVSQASFGIGTDMAVGIKGASNVDAGVWGVTSVGGKPGVLGTSISGLATSIGVRDFANGTGVLGDAQRTAAIGVHGKVSSNFANMIAVYGENVSTGANGHGVYGQSATGYGVLGYSTGGSASMSGISANVNIPAFAGGNSVAGGLAASFAGTVFVNGRLVVPDPSYKSGLLTHPDGSHRLVYCLESPKSWIEDFGRGTLTNGMAAVTLDPDFAAIVQTGDYRVFPVALGDCKGLYVANQTASGFEVRELQGGTSGTPFHYRVVAKPKTERKLSRLEKFSPPEMTLPDVVALTKAVNVPASPKAPDAPPQIQPPSRPVPSAASSPIAVPQGSPPNSVQPAPPPRP
jgi:hypothetical protein